MVCGLDFKSPKIDCRWNSAALCAFVCYPVELVQIKFPRRSPGRRITPEARALASRPPTAGRASTPQSGRTLPPLSCRGRRRALTLRVMAATCASTMATNCRKQGKTRMGLTNSDHGPGSLSSRRPADETPTKPAYLLGQPSPGTRAPRVSSSRAAGWPGHQRPAAARGISSSSPHP